MKNTITSILVLSLIFLASCKKDEPLNEVVGESSLPEFYLGEEENDPIVKEVLGVLDGIFQPRDLDFKPDLNELWVMNKGTNGSDFVIIQNPGSDAQTIVKRKDSHSGHFVVNGTALAFSNINTFATSPEIKNTVQDTNSLFMGPALWSGDLSVFANIHQSNWDPSRPLGSHLDMLHQSPYAMGIAHDNDNIFWVLDGYNGNLCLYDFAADHGPGAEFHADGNVYRYRDVPFSRVRDIPSHIIKDKKSKKLYMCDTKNGKVLELDMSTSERVERLFPTNEALNSYYAYEGTTITTFADQLIRPSGIDINDNRLFVTDYFTGNIHVYDLDTKEELAVLETGEEGITGIKVSKSNRIWFVNYKTHRLYTVVPQ